MIERLEQLTDEVAALHNKLLMLVGPTGTRKSALIADLGHRRAERGEARLLPERAAQLLLHRREFALGAADLVVARRQQRCGSRRTRLRACQSGTSSVSGAANDAATNAASLRRCAARSR